MSFAGLLGLSDLQVLHQRGDTVVLRGRAADGTAVLVKTHASDLPTSASRDRFRREYLSTAAVTHPHLTRARELVDQPARAALVLDDPGGDVLADLLPASRLDLLAVLDVAIEVAEALAALHTHGLVHRAVDAQHIAVTPDGAVLVDLYDAAGVGTRPRRPSHGQHQAPEQRGTTARPADAASDQFAFAVTVRHAVAAVVEEVPAGVAAILDRAAHPDPRARYRSVLGLRDDLRRARDRIARDGRCPAFPLDAAGLSLRWEDPRRIVGRDEVFTELEEAIAAVDADRERGRVVVLRGAQGSGRSALVQAFCDRVAERGLVCGLGRIDDGGAMPFRAGTEVMDQFVDQVLAAPEATLRAVRSELTERIGSDMPVTTQLLPSLALLMGPQPEPSGMSPEEAVVRVERGLRGAVGAIAACVPPLIAVIDDADLADVASLRALEILGGHPDVGPLVMVVVARTERTDLDVTLDRLRAKGVAVDEVALPPLDRMAVRELVADGTGAPAADVAALADAVWIRSGGSPRVALADLWTLLAAGEIWVDVEAGRWRWSDAAVEHDAPITVTEVARRRVRALDPDVRRGLVAVATAGRATTVPMLAEWLGTGTDVAESIVDRGTVERVFSRRSEDGDAITCLDDGVRRAALADLDEGERDAVEHTVARAIVATGPVDESGRPSPSEEARFEVIRLLAGKPSLRSDPAERALYVDLCEAAARTAHRGAAFQEALDLQRSAIEVLGEAGWVEEPARTFDLHLRAAEHALMVVQPAAVDELLATAWAHRPTAAQRVRAMRILGIRSWTRQDHDGGLDELRGILRELGEPIPEKPTWADVAREYAATRRALGSTEPEELLAAPRLTDERLVATLDAMLGCVHLAYVDQPITHVLLVLRGTRLSAEHGITDSSAYFITGYGMLSLSMPFGMERGLRFGRVGMEMGERAGGTIATMVRFAYNSFVRHWGEPLEVTVAPMLDTYRESLAARTRGYGLTGGTFALLHSLLASHPLAAVGAEAAGCAEELGRLNERAFGQRVDIVRQAVSDLRAGPTGEILDGDHFAAEAWLDARPRRGELALIVHTLRAFVALCHGRDDVAAEAVAAARPLVRSAPGQAVVAVHWYQAAVLDALAVGQASGRADRLRARATAERSLRRLRRLAVHAPANVAHRVAFVEALLLENDGRSRAAVARAIQRYDDAVHLATAHGALADLGLIAERAARFHAGRDRRSLARHYATVAADAWHAWGADAVAATLPSRLPGVPVVDRRRTRPVVTDREPGLDVTHDPGRVGAPTSDAVAAETFAEASRLLGQELEVRDFLERMVEVLMRHAGASRAFLVLQTPAGPVVEVAATAQGDVVSLSPLPSPAPADHAELCIPAMNYVLRTRQLLVLDDPAEDRRFRSDPGLRARSPHALLGLPIGRATGTHGAFVFESDDSAPVFEADRVEALRVLSAQAISAIDHARLSSDLSTLSRDVAQLRSTAQLLTDRAETDPLTGVANRRGLEARLERAIGASAADGPGAELSSPQVGVLFCDLDDFKAINDGFGHAVGDGALVEVATRLRSVVRADDIVARLGGDEFIVVCFGATHEELATMAERALEAVARPIDVGEGAVPLSVSIGVGRADLRRIASMDDLDALVDVADDAMYRAKRAGKNRIDHG